MTAHNDVTKYTRAILTNAFAEGKIDWTDLNIIHTSAMPYLTEPDKRAADHALYCHSKDGVVRFDNLTECCEDPPRMLEAIHGVFPTGDCTASLVYDNATAREGLLAALQRESISTFPLQVMTGFAGNFAREYSRLFESPPQFFYMAALTCLGSAVSDRLTLSIGLPVRPRLYVLLLGESADDRKSTAIDMTTEFFGWALPQFPVCIGLGSAEGLQERLTENNQLLLIFDEFKSFVSKCGIDGSTLLPCVTTLYESTRYGSRTKHSKIEIDNAHVSLLAASTVDTYNACWKSQFVDIGFNNRLWLVPGGAKRRFSLPPKMDPDTRYRLKKELLGVLSHVEGCPELSITPSARAIYHDWYINGPKGVHAKRLDTYATRLMALIAANDLKAEVDDATVQKAIALCNNQHDVRRRYDPVDADNEIAKMEIKIRRTLDAGPLSQRDIKMRVNYKRKGIWLYTTAISNLLKMGEIENDRATGGYRRSVDGGV